MHHALNYLQWIDSRYGALLPGATPLSGGCIGEVKPRVYIKRIFPLSFSYPFFVFPCSLPKAIRMMSVFTWINVLLLVVAIYLAKRIWAREKKRAPHPPGPRPKPIIGNITDLPPSGIQEWQHWLKHKDLYGMHNILVLISHIESNTSFLRSNQLCYCFGTDDNNPE